MNLSSSQVDLWLALLLLTLVALGFLGFGFLRKSPKWFVFLALPLFTLSAFLLYFTWGASKQLQEKQVVDTIIAQVGALMADKEVTRAQVIDKLDSLAISAEKAPYALARLATLYQQLGFFDKAATVLSQAIELSPNEPEFQVQWIYNHSLQNQGKLAFEVRQIANALIAQDSHRLILLNLMAIDDFFQERYVNAIQAWQEILTTDQSLSAEKRITIETALEKAKVFANAKVTQHRPRKAALQN